MHSEIKQRIIYKAGDQAATNYKKAISLLMNAKNFKIQGTHNHAKRMKKFLFLLDVLYGSFTTMNSYDHTQIIKYCFTHGPEHCVPNICKHLDHIINIKRKAGIKLDNIINELEESAYVVNEEMYK